MSDDLLIYSQILDITHSHCINDPATLIEHKQELKQVFGFEEDLDDLITLIQSGDESALTTHGDRVNYWFIMRIVIGMTYVDIGKLYNVSGSYIRSEVERKIRKVIRHHHLHDMGAHSSNYNKLYDIVCRATCHKDIPIEYFFEDSVN